MTTIKLEYDTPPKTGPMMLKAALSRKPGLYAGEALGRFEARMNRVRVTQLSAYQKICGFIESDDLPVTMPQIIAAPLHMAVISHPRFPIPALGLVHVSNRITQSRRIRADETLDVFVWIEGHRQARKGCEADLVTEIRIDGIKVWESITTVLSTAAEGHGRPSESTPLVIPSATYRSTWSLPSNLGRRYGTIAGDRNPIHLWPITAKLFGFKRHIIHGMWLLARAMVELDAELGDNQVQVDVAFKRPVFLPSRSHFSAGPHETGLAFRLDHPKTQKAHLFGTVQRLS